MAFEIETGSGSSTANSYVSVSDADTFHLDRGNLAWEELPDDETKQSLLVKASDFLNNVEAFPWRGIRKTAGQSLAWPRVGVQEAHGQLVADNAVPLLVKRAACELALVAYTTVLQPVISRSSSNIKRKEIDVLVTEFFSPEQASAGYGSATALVTSVTGLLKPLLRCQGSYLLNAEPYADLPARSETVRAERPVFTLGGFDNPGG